MRKVFIIGNGTYGKLDVIFINRCSNIKGGPPPPPPLPRPPTPPPDPFDYLKHF